MIEKMKNKNAFPHIIGEDIVITTPVSIQYSDSDLISDVNRIRTYLSKEISISVKYGKIKKKKLKAIFAVILCEIVGIAPIIISKINNEPSTAMWSAYTITLIGIVLASYLYDKIMRNKPKYHQFYSKAETCRIYLMNKLGFKQTSAK